MSRPLLLASVLAAALAGGCGGTDVPPEPTRGVRLDLDAPADAQVVDSDRVELRGRVSPQRAEVRVQGRPVSVAGGAFSTQVELAPGANLVDVTAVALGRRATLMAVRVVREIPVEVPDLRGVDADTVTHRLRGIGLDVRFERGGGLLDSLIPGTLGVCRTDPRSGTKVRPGTTVTVEVARAC